MKKTVWKVNGKFLGGYALGIISMCFLHGSIDLFPRQPHQGWACIVLWIFVCCVTASFAMEKS